MFLFTSLPTSAPPANDNPVAGALRDAAGRTGVSFDYLVKTAQRESNLDPSARAGSSSASGLFQFLEQTWLGLVKNDGAQLGVGSVSSQVVQGADGRFTIADPKLKAKVLALRDDPQVAAVAAGVFTAKNRESLTASLGRQPTEGELYIAHFLGAGGAADLVRLNAVKPGAKAASYFPDAAAANRGVFFERSGRARTASEVYNSLIAGHEAAGQAARVQLAASTVEAPPAAVVTATDAVPGRPLLGLFRSLPANAADTVQKSWSGLPRRSGAIAGPRTAFFPRGDGSASEPTIAAAVPAAPPLAQVDVPLPPLRPARLVASGAAPLDLLGFMRIKR